ncbi:hypothetical protein GCM10011369_04540 [Neiella marina]|uniref:Phosphoserine phosphatase n=1 Tax=Neiella marina TaxID=508461 RepID=A0A8J2XMP9_9GAMM|nr:phosphoserine phosphatase SerB [Neiella marina]GGA66106.1 hypothetical protein GCM10011369_04540 [Neiella marina]
MNFCYQLEIDAAEQTQSASLCEIIEQYQPCAVTACDGAQLTIVSQTEQQGASQSATDLAQERCRLVIQGLINVQDLSDILALLPVATVRTDWVASLYQPESMGALVLGLAAVPDDLQRLTDLAADKAWECNLLTQAPTVQHPGLLLMDMDSTAIEIECIDEIAKLAGVGEQVAEVTELAMQGKLDFAESLRARVATLTDADEVILARVREQLPMSPGLPELVTALRQKNWRVAIASGGFTYFADYLKETLPLDAAVSNVLEINDGKLTGKVLGGIVDAQRKADTLIELAEQFDIQPSQTVAAGDGANDLVMMDAAALGVAYHAKPVVAAKATTALKFHGLEGIYYLLASATS